MILDSNLNQQCNKCNEFEEKNYAIQYFIPILLKDDIIYNCCLVSNQERVDLFLVQWSIFI